MKYYIKNTLLMFLLISYLSCGVLTSTLHKKTFNNKVELLDMLRISNPLFKEKKTQVITQIEPEQQLKLKYQIIDEVSLKDSIEQKSQFLKIRIAEYDKIIKTINKATNPSKLMLIQKEDKLEIVFGLKLKISETQKNKLKEANSMSLDNSDSYRSKLLVYNKKGIDKINLSELDVVDFETACLCWQLQNNKPKLISINKKCPKGSTSDVRKLKSKSFKDYE